MAGGVGTAAVMDKWKRRAKKPNNKIFRVVPKVASKVPGRKGMSYTEEDWGDKDATAHRGPDD